VLALEQDDRAAGFREGAGQPHAGLTSTDHGVSVTMSLKAMPAAAGKSGSSTTRRPP